MLTQCTVGRLSQHEISVLRAFAWKVETGVTEDAFSKAHYAFPSACPPTWDQAKSLATRLAALNAVLYDCCINSCQLFVGLYAAEERCTECHEPRYSIQQKPRKQFMYIPLIPRLEAYFSNPSVIAELRYRAEFAHDPSIIKDVFDCDLYRNLLLRNVKLDNKTYARRYFEDERDFALGLSTDGFAPFKRRKSTCWPLIIFNYNYPPDVRFHLDKILCVGVVPGPRKPKDFDSFLWPLVEELLTLSLGVTAYDYSKRESFKLCAYLFLCFGDIPAMSMLMHMKGHNGFCPCRTCNITGVRATGSRSTIHYVPLDRSRHPNPGELKIYDPRNLPLRTHDSFMYQASQVQYARTAVAEAALSKQYGIKGIPLLSKLSSLSFPMSFPYDFMHLMWENVLKNLVLLWTGDFKEMDEGSGSYQFPKGVWESIGAATASAGAWLPSAFGPRPPNVADDKSHCTADSWSFWMLYIAPIVLEGCLERRYYKHFMSLVDLVHRVLQFELKRDQLAHIRDGFIQWVLDYEK